MTKNHSTVKHYSIRPGSIADIVTRHAGSVVFAICLLALGIGY